MGNSTQSSNKNFFNQWVQISRQKEVNGNDKIIWAKINERSIQMQEYTLYVTSQQQLNQEQRIHSMRHNHPQLVSSLHFKNESQEQFCASNYKGRIFIQRIPLTLQQITDVPYPDALHIFSQSLQGFHLLANQVESGCFPVQQQYIGVNCESICKVWMNNKVNRNYPRRNQRIIQEKMVKNILEIIQKNTDLASLHGKPNPSLYIYTKAKNPLEVKFGQAINLFRNYVNEYFNGLIPERLFCVEKIGGAYLLAKNWQGQKSQFMQLVARNGQIKERQVEMNSYYQSPEISHVRKIDENLQNAGQIKIHPNNMFQKKNNFFDQQQFFKQQEENKISPQYQSFAINGPFNLLLGNQKSISKSSYTNKEPNHIKQDQIFGQNNKITANLIKNIAQVQVRYQEPNQIIFSKQTHTNKQLKLHDYSQYRIPRVQGRRINFTHQENKIVRGSQSSDYFSPNGNFTRVVSEKGILIQPAFSTQTRQNKQDYNPIRLNQQLIPESQQQFNFKSHQQPNQLKHQQLIFINNQKSIFHKKQTIPRVNITEELRISRRNQKASTGTETNKVIFEIQNPTGAEERISNRRQVSFMSTSEVEKVSSKLLLINKAPTLNNMIQFPSSGQNSLQRINQHPSQRIAQPRNTSTNNYTFNKKHYDNKISSNQDQFVSDQVISGDLPQANSRYNGGFLIQEKGMDSYKVSLDDGMSSPELLNLLKNFKHESTNQQTFSDGSHFKNLPEINHSSEPSDIPNNNPIRQNIPQSVKSKPSNKSYEFKTSRKGQKSQIQSNKKRQIIEYEDKKNSTGHKHFQQESIVLENKNESLYQNQTHEFKFQEYSNRQSNQKVQEERKAQYTPINQIKGSLLKIQEPFTGLNATHLSNEQEQYKVNFDPEILADLQRLKGKN